LAATLIVGCRWMACFWNAHPVTAAAIAIAAIAVFDIDCFPVSRAPRARVNSAWPTAPRASRSVEHAAEHRLEVARFRHLGQERMVGAGAGDLQHLHRAPGVVRGTAQHVEELFLADEAGARERREQA